MNPKTRARLAAVHRWTALALSPVIVLILLSGIVLAFRPIVGDADDGTAKPVVIDPRQLVSLLQHVDPQGKAGFMFVQDDGRTVTLPHPGPGTPPSYDLATARSVPTPPPARDPVASGVFDVAMRVHKELWVGLGGLVTLASLAMIVLVILGPLMARPRRPGTTVRGWHMWAGWVAWPLMALLPLSLVAMKLHLPAVTHAGRPLALADAVSTAAAQIDLTHLRAVQGLPGGSAMLVTEDARGDHRFILRGGRVSPFDSEVSRIGHAVHEGTWAGPWSGLLNLVAALGLLAMLVSGVWSWIRGLRRGRAAPPVQRRSRSAEPAMAAD